jgi:hypothetical protein
VTDNILQFPDRMKEEIDEQQWKALQAEFYLDCYLAAKGEPASEPAELESWLLHARIKADIENPFFRGWLVRRLSEASTVPG